MWDRRSSWAGGCVWMSSKASISLFCSTTDSSSSLALCTRKHIASWVFQSTLFLKKIQRYGNVQWAKAPKNMICVTVNLTSEFSFTSSICCCNTDSWWWPVVMSGHVHTWPSWERECQNWFPFTLLCILSREHIDSQWKRYDTNTVCFFRQCLPRPNTCSNLSFSCSVQLNVFTAASSSFRLISFSVRRKSFSAISSLDCSKASWSSWQTKEQYLNR